jgi:hypothetical protein
MLQLAAGTCSTSLTALTNLTHGPPPLGSCHHNMFRPDLPFRALRGKHIDIAR